MLNGTNMYKEEGGDGLADEFVMKYANKEVA